PPADSQSCFSARAPNDGADPVELVPAVRPESADVCPEYLLGQTGRLPQGDATGLSLRQGEQFHRAASRRPMTRARAGGPGRVRIALNARGSPRKEERPVGTSYDPFAQQYRRSKDAPF